MSLALRLSLLTTGLALTALACSGNDTPAVPVETDETDAQEDTFVIETGDTGEPVDTDPVIPPRDYDCDEPAAPGLAGFCDFSVNAALGESPTEPGDPVVLRVEATQPAAAGAFNGAGRGNRAITGLHGYDRLPISGLGDITIDAEYIVGRLTQPGALGPEVGLIVDLDCEGGPWVYVSAIFANLPAPVAVNDDVDRYTASPSAAIWTATLGLYAPDDPETPILPDPDVPDGALPGPLSVITEHWPEACLRNRDMNDPGLPRDVDTSGLLITLGKPTTQTKAEWRLHRVTVGADTHSPP